MKNKNLLITIMLFVQISVAQTIISNETVTDIDGNVYHTVNIGTQTWLVENLKTTKYIDGTPIPNVPNGSAWNALTSGAWCIYKNSTANDKKYGKLYNWYAVSTGKLAPEGWHVSTSSEWSLLNSYTATHTGFSGSVGKALAATTDWSTTTDAGAIGNDIKKNNSTGFTALPGGGRLIEGSFYMIGDYGTWWTSTGSSKDMGSRNGKIIDSDYKKTIGLSVRCVKDDITTKETPPLEATKPEKAKEILVSSLDGNNKYRGLEYVKNFHAGKPNLIMDKKLEDMDKVFLHLSESERKLDLDIYSYTKEENSYKIIYSLCYIKNILFLINLNISPTDEKGIANTQTLVDNIKYQLGYFDSKKIENASIWKYDDYSAIIKNEKSDYNVTFMNLKTGQKFLSSEKTYKYNSGYNSH